MTRHAGLDYHVLEARAWLAIACFGKASTPLAYAAFELRLAIERILQHYLYSSEPSAFGLDDLRLTGKRLEGKIYRTAGHQRRIEGRVRVSEIIFEMLGKPGAIARPKFGELARDWEYCSEFCHAGWTLLSGTISDADAEVAFNRLREIAEQLLALSKQLVSIPRLEDRDFIELENRFLGQDRPQKTISARSFAAAVSGHGSSAPTARRSSSEPQCHLPMTLRPNIALQQTSGRDSPRAD